MTILSVVKQVCTAVGLAEPTVVFASTEREMVEMRNLANEVARAIAIDGHDWTKLKTLATLTGDGSAQSFSLPSDYARMLKTSRLWPSAAPFAPLQHYADTDEWLGLTVQNFQTIVGAWTIIGEAILVKPSIPNGSTVQFYYLSGNIVKPATGSPKLEFTADDDSFRLDERLLKLGLIWQWKSAKGQSYGEEMASYEDALAVASGSDRGSTKLVVGGRRVRDAEIAFPGVIIP